MGVSGWCGVSVREWVVRGVHEWVVRGGRKVFWDRVVWWYRIAGSAVPAKNISEW